ncbi:MAG: FG-GAP-like repeat-containing protein [Verrucomicrobiales bacterium]
MSSPAEATVPRIAGGLLLGWVIAFSSAGCGGSDPPPKAAGEREQPIERAQAISDDGRATAEPKLGPPPTDEDLGQMPKASEAAEAFLSDEFANLDAAAAGWDSEVASAEADHQLKEIGKWLAHAAENPPAGDLEPLLAPDFACAPLRPEKLNAVFRDSATRVFRPPRRDAPAPAQHAGAAGLATALSQLAGPLAGAGEIRSKFKTIRVSIAGEAMETTSYFEISGSRDAGRVQISATWKCRWRLGESVTLQSIAVEDYEEILPEPGGALRFDDATLGVLGTTESYASQIAQSYDHWRVRTDRSLQSDLAGNHGLAVGDANGDGLDDVYLLRSGGLPNRLFLHQPDGTAQDAPADSGLDWLDFSRSALFLDFDNDGDQDLVLALAWHLLFLENDGTGRFALRSSRLCPGSVYSLAAADFDGDGDLDVYACGRYPAGSVGGESRVQGLPLPYHDANNGGPGSLWRNDGGWAFTDVTKAVGMDENNRRFSLAAAWEDYDNDGDPDLYVANDFGRNNLYRNDGGSFRDVAAELGVEDIGAGMSAAWGDYNNDGWMDLYVGNMFSSAGQRVTGQRQFMAGIDDATLGDFKRHARGNSLFLNQGGKGFSDATMEAAVNYGRWAWGAVFSDFNNDGREDLFVANGFITTEDTGDL